MHKRLIVLSLLLGSAPAWAAIDLLPKLAVVQGNTPGVVTITNRSDHPEFVTVSLSRLLNPGVAWREERLEPVGQAHNPSLYVWPLRLSLAQGQSKNITLQPLQQVRQESVWRLEVSPVTALSGQDSPALAGGVAVNLRFSALVRQLPQKQTESLSSACSGGSITFTATGTLRYPVHGLTLNGAPAGDFNVYPGTPITLAGQHAAINGRKVCR